MHSRQMALCGVLCALAAVVSLLGGLIPVATFCAPLVCMAILLPVRLECGCTAALASYGAVALLGFLLVPNREQALVYLVFGWYPALRPAFCRIRPAALQVVCKLLVCNGAIFLLYGVLSFLLWGDAALEAPYQQAVTALLLILGNGTFLAMDVALGRLGRLWQRKLRKRFFRP